MGRELVFVLVEVGKHIAVGKVTGTNHEAVRLGERRGHVNKGSVAEILRYVGALLAIVVLVHGLVVENAVETDSADMAAAEFRVAEVPSDVLAQGKAAFGAIVDVRERIHAVMEFAAVIRDLPLVGGQQVPAPVRFVSGLEAPAEVVDKALLGRGKVKERHAFKYKGGLLENHVLVGKVVRLLCLDEVVEGVFVVRAGRDLDVFKFVGAVTLARGLLGNYAENGGLDIKPGSDALACLVVVLQMVGARNALPRANQDHIAVGDDFPRPLIHADEVCGHLRVAMPYEHVALGNDPAIGGSRKGVGRDFDRDFGTKRRRQVKGRRLFFRQCRHGAKGDDQKRS